MDFYSTLENPGFSQSGQDINSNLPNFELISSEGSSNESIAAQRSHEDLVPNQNGFEVSPEKPDFYRVRRDSLVNFRFLYKILPEYVRHQFRICIEIVSGESDKNLTQCTNKSHNNERNVFMCNGRDVLLTDSCEIPFSNDRMERIFTFVFYCTNQCSSMHSETKLKFTVLDDQDAIFYKKEIPFKVSERPNRDSRMKKRKHETVNE